MVRLAELKAMPPILVACLATIWPLVLDLQSQTRDLSAVEFHCGEAAITNNVNAVGLACLGLDLRRGQDMNTPSGRSAHVTAVMRLKFKGLLWTAQECKTLIWAGRAQTGRSMNNPAGDLRNPKVRNANVQLFFMVACLLLAWLRGAFSCSENPRSSLIKFLSPFREFLSFLGISESVLSYMGGFGASTPKALHFWGDWPEIRKLARASGPEAIVGADS